MLVKSLRYFVHFGLVALIGDAGDEYITARTLCGESLSDSELLSKRFVLRHMSCLLTPIAQLVSVEYVSG